MEKTRESSARDSWREKVWQGTWEQTHHGGNDKERSLLCLHLAAAESFSAAAPSQRRGWVCQPFALNKGEQSLTSLHSEHPTQTNLHCHSQHNRKGRLVYFLFYFSPLLAIQCCFNWGCWVVKSIVTTTKSWFTGSPLIFLHFFSVVSAQWGENTFSKENISTAQSISIVIFAAGCLQNRGAFCSVKVQWFMTLIKQEQRSEILFKQSVWWHLWSLALILCSREINVSFLTVWGFFFHAAFFFFFIQ